MITPNLLVSPDYLRSSKIVFGRSCIYSIYSTECTTQPTKTIQYNDILTE